MGIVQGTTDNAQVQSRLGEIKALQGEASRRFTQTFGTVGQDGTVSANMANIQKAGEVLQDANEQAAWTRAAQLSFVGQLRQISGQVIGKDGAKLDFTLRRTENGWAFANPGGNTDETQQFLNFVRGAGTDAVKGFEGNRNPVVQLSGLSFDGVQDGEVGGYKTSMSELLKYVPTEETFRNAVAVSASPASGSSGPSPARPGIQPGQPAAGQSATPGTAPTAGIQPPPAAKLLPATPPAGATPTAEPTVVEPTKLAPPDAPIPTPPATPIPPVAAPKMSQAQFYEQAQDKWARMMDERTLGIMSPPIISTDNQISMLVTYTNKDGSQGAETFILPPISSNPDLQAKYAQAVKAKWGEVKNGGDTTRVGGLMFFKDSTGKLDIYMGVGNASSLNRTFSFPSIDSLSE